MEWKVPAGPVEGTRERPVFAQWLCTQGPGDLEASALGGYL